ncbi:MAG: cytochrome d ubiquinol oxidase subunit I [Rhodoferax sp.]
MLTTAETASTVPASNILLILVLYLSLYACWLFAYVRVVFYLVNKVILKAVLEEQYARPNS